MSRLDKTVTGAENMETCCLLAFSPKLLVQLPSLCNPGLTAQVRHCPQWTGHPFSISNQKNTPKGMATSESGRDFLTEAPSSQVSLGCFKLTKTIKYNVPSLVVVL